MTKIMAQYKMRCAYVVLIAVAAISGGYPALPAAAQDGAAYTAIAVQEENQRPAQAQQALVEQMAAHETNTSDIIKRYKSGEMSRKTARAALDVEDIKVWAGRYNLVMERQKYLKKSQGIVAAQQEIGNVTVAGYRKVCDNLRTEVAEMAMTTEAMGLDAIADEQYRELSISPDTKGDELDQRLLEVQVTMTDDLKRYEENLAKDIQEEEKANKQMTKLSYLLTRLVGFHDNAIRLLKAKVEAMTKRAHLNEKGTARDILDRVAVTSDWDLNQIVGPVGERWQEALAESTADGQGRPSKRSRTRYSQDDLKKIVTEAHNMAVERERR